jgi:hypothetical protein
MERWSLFLGKDLEDAFLVHFKAEGKIKKEVYKAYHEVIP